VPLGVGVGVGVGQMSVMILSVHPPEITPKSPPSSSTT
jgi:hypothetical protein